MHYSTALPQVVRTVSSEECRITDDLHRQRVYRSVEQEKAKKACKGNYIKKIHRIFRITPIFL